jgi:thioredoxin reductase (NADPH)
LSDSPIVIIGAGPAGSAAAVQCERLGVPALLLDRSGEAGGLVVNGYSVENYPGLAPLDGQAFAQLLRDHLARFSVRVKRGRVQRIDPDGTGFTVSGDFGQVHTRSVICAVGTSPIALDVPGAAEIRGRGLFYHVRNLMDFIGKQNADRARGRVFVIGGGEAALDYSLSIARAGANVTVLVRGRELRARGRLVTLVSHTPAIQVVFGAAVSRVQGAADGVELWITRGGTTELESAGAVVAAIGRKSRAGGLLEGLDTDLPTDVTTRVPGLFVAGDARTGSLGQIGMAVGDGLTAAMAAVAYVEGEA